MSYLPMLQRPQKLDVSLSGILHISSWHSA